MTRWSAWGRPCWDEADRAYASAIQGSLAPADLETAYRRVGV